MTKRKFLTRVLPLLIVIALILVYLFIFRESFTKGMIDAVNSFK